MPQNQHNILAVDYDGTLARDGRVDAATVDALVQWREADGWLILVTGRRLEPLLEVFPQIHLFHLVVAENGGLLYHPNTAEEQSLADPPPREFVKRLCNFNVPFEVGRVIVATDSPHETAVLQAIRELGLELSLIFNKRAVMVLPSGINKATGLEAALEKLQLSRRQAIGVGDAENDEAFMKFCDVAVAVGNALPAVKELSDLVTEAERGAGVAECIQHFLKSGQPEKSS